MASWRRSPRAALVRRHLRPAPDPSRIRWGSVVGRGRTTALALGHQDVGSTTDPSALLPRMEQHPHGSIADSFGLLDLSAHGFDLLFAATWLHHPGRCSGRRRTTAVLGPRPRLRPDGRWNQHHDTVGVLPSDLRVHPRFTVLARQSGDDLTGGAILHDAGTVVGLSNIWSAEDASVDPRELLDVAATNPPRSCRLRLRLGRGPRHHAGRRVRAMGPHHVWIR